MDANLPPSKAFSPPTEEELREQLADEALDHTIPVISAVLPEALRIIAASAQQEYGPSRKKRIAAVPQAAAKMAAEATLAVLADVAAGLDHPIAKLAEAAAGRADDVNSLRGALEAAAARQGLTVEELLRAAETAALAAEGAESEEGGEQADADLDDPELDDYDPEEVEADPEGTVELRYVVPEVEEHRWDEFRNCYVTEEGPEPPASWAVLGYHGPSKYYPNGSSPRILPVRLPREPGMIQIMEHDGLWVGQKIKVLRFEAELMRKDPTTPQRLGLTLEQIEAAVGFYDEHRSLRDDDSDGAAGEGESQ